jgi:hypothetical protein
MNNLANIREVLANSPARQVKPGIEVWDLNTGPWWKLFMDYQELERTKRQLLSAAWALPGSLFFHPPTPVEPELMPFLVRDDESNWLLNRRRSPDEFYENEFEGNWVLYAAEHPISATLPNTFKTEPSSLISFLREHEVTFLIDSFCDDAEWRIALIGS